MNWRRPYAVVRRSGGAWNRGKYLGAQETADSLLGTVQPAKLTDYSRMKSGAEGRTFNNLVRLYTVKQLTPAGRSHPGDLVVIDGVRHVIVGVADRRILGGPTSHICYLLASEAEHAAGEVLA